ncbi:MAG TPA: sigma-70 family RNA polymerase sigma factor [Pyrinomonadaceae bacterium]|nr:sigma-70 family RNA polymerase sigma factor [Pyrinomonadaceae bacterium]
MSKEQLATERTTPDPGVWVDEHGDYLYRYAMFRLRDASLAEDVVQETLLAALQAYAGFGGRGSERTWLVGILKHKVADYFRRLSRETTIQQDEGEALWQSELFMQTGEWVGHWVAAVHPEQAEALGPIEWRATPEQLLEQGEFWEVFNRCLSPLPARIASAFTLREVDGLTSEEICDILDVKVNNLWVMLHRARAHLRRCIEVSWFKREQSVAKASR